ncbi:MAG: 3-deoxy-8-phosphooctulonate synthase, partial [Megasphaera micronuciformis]
MKSVKVGNTVLDGSSLFVLAGPCVIEDPERTLNIGREMKKICEKLGLPYV